MKMHSVILSADDNIWRLISIMTNTYPEFTESKIRYFVDGITNAVVEACRYSGKSMSTIFKFINELRSNIALSNEVNKLPINEVCTIVKELAITILCQIEELGLYDENGILMYTFKPIHDHRFNDIVLYHIQRLTWNKGMYELPAY
jgi:hypothetical protein